MQITHDLNSKKLWLSQQEYIERLLETNNMKENKQVSSPLGDHFKLSRKCCFTLDEKKKKMKNIPYSSVVGSLMYVMVCIRPNIAHAVEVVSRFLSNLGKEHWKVVKWIFKYLKGSLSTCLCFGGAQIVFEGFTDADMIGDIDNRRSTLGYLITFVRGAVSW